MIYLISTRKVNIGDFQTETETGTGMNDKFFDLKKEKQDRMINAALKVFALKGYEHASTDDIVREAGISKGLLFHYFISKLGLYTFIYDYSVRYLMLELSTGVTKEEADYFDLIRQILSSQIQMMHNYPYMLQFLNESRREDVSEALVATEEKRGIWPHQYKQIMRRADTGKFKKCVDVERMTRIINFTINGMLSQQICGGSFQPDLFGEDVREYLDMLRKMSYQDE